MARVSHTLEKLPVGNFFFTILSIAILVCTVEQYDGMIPVAINAKQYGGSDACGACIEGVGTGKGSGSDPIKGKFKAYVIDQCPECEHGVSVLRWGS